MWLIVGLGNPGSEYKLTRHNIGFMAVDHFLKTSGQPPMKNQFKAEIFPFKLNDTPVIFVKPQTFMNLSGEAVQALMGFYKIPLDHLLVVHDDIDLPFGQMRLQKNRGHGGQNGVRSISTLLGSMDYARLKLGVGRPENPNIPVVDYVLGRFDGEQEKHLSAFMKKAGDAIEAMVRDGLQKASTNFNS
jgi:PTH1 family peptidyl-tRNA hydrolase